MKHKYLSLLTLALVGALLFVGCSEHPPEKTDPVITSTVVPQTTTATTTAATTPPYTAPPPFVNPTPTYRPDLIWSTGLPPYQYINGDGSSQPMSGQIIVEYLGGSPLGDGDYHFYDPEHETTEFAVYFLYYDIDVEYRNAHNDMMRPCNWDALVDYLAELGIEEVGREGGFSIPIFAATMVELDVLDCKTLQDVMGVTDYSPYGLSLCISSITEERNIGNPDILGMQCYAYMDPWVDADE